MKYLIILFLAAISFTANAQSAIVPLDVTGSSVTGGDGTGSIVSYTWTALNPPFAISYTDSTGLKTGSNQLAKTWVKITKAGTYNFQIDVVDNLGQKASGTIQVIAYDMQQIIIKIVQPVVKVYLK